MSRIKFQFAYAPEPAPDETLGSWVHRIAIAQGVCGSAFIGPKDIDWNPPSSALTMLASGSGQSRARLQAMCLDQRYPHLTRKHFAKSSGQAFPACHAFCPLCAEEDKAMYGQPILRASNAGLWRLACSKHGCFLDSVESETEVTPSKNFRHEAWINGRIGRGRPPSAAAPIVFAFERAIAKATRGKFLSSAWWVRDPDQFLDLADLLTSLAVVHRRGGSQLGPTPAWALLGAREPNLYGQGGSEYEPYIHHRIPAWLRVRAMTAAARLLLDPSQGRRLGENMWWAPYGTWSHFVGFPWVLATGAMSRSSLELVWQLSSDWPEGLRSHVRTVLRQRFTPIGAHR